MRTLARGSAFGLVLVALVATACNGDDPEEFTPVVFAHGCPPPPLTSEDDAGLWTGETQDAPGFDDFFLERGYPEDHLNVFLYSEVTCPPNNDYADALADYVDGVLAATGRPKVALLAFSMGALASRIYLRQGGDQVVSHFVSISGASHGSVLAGMVGEAGQEEFGYPNYQGAFEASPPYACEGESTEEDVQFFLNGCLTEDGRTVEVDETPNDVADGGEVAYLAIWNTVDDLVIPPESACLNQASQNDCSDPVNVSVTVEAVTEILPDTVSSHVETQFDPAVRQRVFDFVAE